MSAALKVGSLQDGTWWDVARGYFRETPPGVVPVFKHLELPQRLVAGRRGFGHGEQALAVHHVDEAVGDQVGPSLELVPAAVPQLVSLQVEAGELLPARVGANAVNMAVVQDRRLLLRLEPPRLEPEQRLRDDPAALLLQPEHQAAGVVAAREEDAAVAHNDRRGAGGHLPHPLGRLPQHRPVVGRDAGHALRPAVDVHPPSAQIHRHDRRMGHLPVAKLGAFPHDLARAVVDRHHERAPRRGQDHAPAVHQRTLARVPLRHGRAVAADHVEQPVAPAGFRVPAGDVAPGTDRDHVSVGHRGHGPRHAVALHHHDRVAVAPNLLAVVQGEAAHRVGLALRIVVEHVDTAAPDRRARVPRPQLNGPQHLGAAVGPLPGQRHALVADAVPLRSAEPGPRARHVGRLAVGSDRLTHFGRRPGTRAVSPSTVPVFSQRATSKVARRAKPAGSAVLRGGRLILSNLSQNGPVANVHRFEEALAERRSRDRSKRKSSDQQPQAHPAPKRKRDAKNDAASP